MGEGDGRNVGNVAAMPVAKTSGIGSVLNAKKCFEARGSDNRAFIAFFPSLATSVAKACFALLFFKFRLKPTA